MSDSKIIWIGVAVAVLLHIVVALAIVNETIFSLIFPKKKTEEVVEKPPEPKPVMSFTITPRPKIVPVIPEVVQPELPKPKPKPEEKQQYARTSAEQPKGKSDDPRFYGDEDTIAQSNAETDPNAANVPSIDGTKKDSLSMASRFQEGSLENENLGNPSKPTELTPPSELVEVTEPEQPTEEPKVTEVEPLEPKQSESEKALASSDEPKVDFLDLANKLPSEIKAEEPLVESSLKDKGKADREREKEEQLKEVVKNEERPKSKERTKPRTIKISNSGFRPETEAGKVVGSISRRGSVSSLDVEGTPLGKYKKSVQDSIAQEWYKRTGRNSDLILPGTIQVTYLVYESGKVKVLDLNVLQGSEIQTGITLQSITSAKIPKLPSALKKDLKGEPVEMTITFNFLN